MKVNFLHIARINLSEKMTQEKAAELVGVTTRTIQNMEQEKTYKKVSIGTVLKYCQVLNIKNIEVPEIVKPA